MPKDSSAQSGPTAGGNVRAISHWSNVAPGEYFTVTFEESDRIPAHLEQSQFIGKEVKLMRDSGSGFTVSCHDDWSYQATVNSDTRYHALTSAASKIKYWGVKKPKKSGVITNFGILGGCFMYFNGAQAVHHCKLVTEEKPYGSHASAAKSRWKGRAPEPCSNVPMKCPFKCKEIFWKWSMMKHLTEKHASAAHQMTDASRQQFGLRAHERHYTMALFNNPGKLLENACPKESAPKSPHECDCV